jgi:myo-inositol-1(or 4)-monophosphatase
LPDLSAFAAILPRVEATVREAGDIAMEYFRRGALTKAQVSLKHGGSPVTEADLRIDRLLYARLSELAPGVGWLSEETVDSPERLSHETLFIADPIDGTRGFMAGDPCFCVSLALVFGDRPVYGIVHAPALAQTFVASLGGGATLNGAPIYVSTQQQLSGARLAAPDHLHKIMGASGLTYERQPRLPSLAMRLLRVAEGQFDAALARENSCDWDIAAADLILHEAGGVLTDLQGRAPSYNRATPRHSVLAAGPPALQARLIEAASGGAAKSRQASRN